MLNDKQLSIDKPPVVSLESFGKFISWFGPMNKEILDNLYEICSEKKWFWGRVDTRDPQIATYLESNKNSFMVRMSSTQEGYFAISLLDQKGQVIHVRIFYNQIKNYYAVELKGTEKHFKTLEELVKEAKKEYGLEDPQDVSPLNKIIRGEHAPVLYIGKN